MASESTSPYRFGDLLALARQSWVSQMASGLAALGYPDSRRSDAAVIRLLQRGPVSIGPLGEALGVTRQAARKVADGLERRGLAVTARDGQDSRQVNILLTPGGEAYAQAVVTVIDRLDEDLRRRVEPDQLVAADAVLRAVLHDDRSRQRAARLAPRPRHSAEATPPEPGGPP